MRISKHRLHPLLLSARPRAKGLMAASTVLVLLVAAISCQTVSRSVVVLPMAGLDSTNALGATYIGSSECASCHDDLHPELMRGFPTSDHARLVTEGANAKSVGCESCHGPGSLHQESGGERKPPYTFTSGRSRPTDQDGRLAVPTARAMENVCYQCHADVRGRFNLPSHHPVPEGRMTCAECHPPHKGHAHLGGSTALRSQDETCLRCHPSQRGPHVFEHEAMREGCATCHDPHGAVNARMLTARDSNLCLKCHFVQRGALPGEILIGGAPHQARLSQGTCWTAGCHEAVHGSRVSSSLRF